MIKRTKTIVTIILALSLVVSMLTSCGSKNDDDNDSSDKATNSKKESEMKEDDCKVIIDMIKFAETLSADVEYEIEPGNTFQINIKDGVAKFAATKSNVTKEWQDKLKDGDVYKITSSEFSKISVTYDGVVKGDGSIEWSADGDRNMVEFSKDLLIIFPADHD